MTRGTLEICQEIADKHDERMKLDYEIFALKGEVEDITGMDYDEFIEDMRKLMAPA